MPHARAQSGVNPLEDPAVLRVREAFSVDGIALFDMHAQHAARMGACAASVFAGLKWCVSGTGEETKADATYVKTTGYNADSGNRIVYAVSTRRGYPLKRDGFDAVVKSIGARFGAGAAVYAFRAKSAEGGEVDSLIAVWGGLRLVHLAEAEYAVVEGGGSLRRGHLVDHRFNLVISAKQREPIYKIEGEAGYILHFMAQGPDRADIVARAVYPPAFLPPPAKPEDVPSNPLAADAVKPPRVQIDDRGRAGQGRAAEAERALAAERLLREEAERKLEEMGRALEELGKRGQSERKGSDERKAAEEGQQKEEAERKSSEGRRATAERERRAEAERKAAEAKRIADEKRIAEEKRAAEERRAREESERKAAEERKAREEQAKRPEPPRDPADADKGGPEDGAKPDEDRARPSDAERARRSGEAERRAESERAARAARDRAARDADWHRKAAEAAAAAGASWSLNESEDRASGERGLYAQAIFAGADGAGIEIVFECRAGHDRRLRATARGFDRNSGSRVPFRSEDAGAFRVKTLVRIDGKPPQEGHLFRESDDDTVSIVEVPLAPGDISIRSARAGAWLRHYAVAIEFHLMAGTVTATVAPYAANLRRVLEACAE